MITKQERALFAKVGRRGGRKVLAEKGHQHFVLMNKIRWDNYRKRQKDAIQPPVDNSNQNTLDKLSEGV